jgi:hypothetical protein
MNMLSGSWKTTVLGILGGLGILFGQVTALLDSDPNTVFSLETMMAGLGVLGLGFFARDNGVSSESAGAK